MSESLVASGITEDARHVGLAGLSSSAWFRGLCYLCTPFFLRAALGEVLMESLQNVQSFARPTRAERRRWCRSRALSVKAFWSVDLVQVAAGKAMYVLVTVSVHVE